MPSCKAPFTDLCLPSKTVAHCEPSSTKVRVDTPGPKRTSISSDTTSHSRGRSIFSLPSRKQHLAGLPTLVGEHPLCTTRQQLAPCAIWRNAHPYMGPHCSFEHHDFISYCAASEEIDFRSPGSTEDNTILLKNFCPALIPLLTSLLIYAATRSSGERLQLPKLNRVGMPKLRRSFTSIHLHAPFGALSHH